MITPPLQITKLSSSGAKCNTLTERVATSKPAVVSSFFFSLRSSPLIVDQQSALAVVPNDSFDGAIITEHARTPRRPRIIATSTCCSRFEFFFLFFSLSSWRWSFDINYRLITTQSRPFGARQVTLAPTTSRHRPRTGTIWACSMRSRWTTSSRRYSFPACGRYRATRIRNCTASSRTLTAPTYRGR